MFNRTFTTIILAAVMFWAAMSISAQQALPRANAQEVSEVDGVPVLLKHLPEWEKVKSSAVFARSVEDLKKTLGERPALDLVELTAGTEAVTAQYPEGKLLIVEYTNPQSSIEADTRFQQKLAEQPQNPPVVYRRVGNYSVFVFDAADPVAAAGLIDQVKYQKVVQWLGEDPYLLQKLEKYFIHTTRDIFLSTVLWIIMGFGLAIVSGVIAGIIFFRFRDGKRANRTAFSDAGGLTRLNLDDLSEPIPLKELA